MFNINKKIRRTYEGSITYHSDTVVSGYYDLKFTASTTCKKMCEIVNLKSITGANKPDLSTQ